MSVLNYRLPIFVTFYSLLVILSKLLYIVCSKPKGGLSEDVKERRYWKTAKPASDIITREGGAVTADGVQLVCPPGAVDNPVCIKITPEDPVKYYGLIVQKGLQNDVIFGAPILNLQPNGYLFKKPVTLTTTIKIDEGNFRCDDGLLVLHGTEGRDGTISWQDITQRSIIDVTRKEVSIEIKRFSFVANLLTLTRIRTKEIISRLNLSSFNYTMSVLFKENSSEPELALAFMSQDIFHEPYYKEHDASTLMQLRNDGFKLLRSFDGPTDKRIFNSESLKVSVSLGEDYKLARSHQSSIDVPVESHVWWSTGHVIRLPLKETKDVRILCGKISVQGQYGHNSEYQFCEQDLCGYVKRLLGVEGAIFNVKPIAQKIETNEETTAEVMKSWRNEDDQLKVLLQPWLKDNGKTEDLAKLRKGLEDLREEEYKVTQRGQMHITNLKELAIKITESKTKNAELMKYFTGKIKTLCKMVFKDCCIELKTSVDEDETAVSSEDHANYLEVHQKISQDTSSKYQHMCSSPQESIAKNFLAMVPHLIQDIKGIFRDAMIPDVQNGLRGLQKETLDQLASNVREAERNHEIRKLVCEVCKILEELCVKNCDSQHSTNLIRKWGECLGIWSMLEFLKPFFQKCPQDVRLHKRLELFSRCMRDIMSDVIDADEVFMRDFFDVSSSLIQFAKFEPAKLVRFKITDPTNSPVICKSEGVKYDTHSDIYSQLFFFRKEEEGELLLHAIARVHVKGGVHKKGAFQSVITLPLSAEKAFDSWMTPVPANVVVTKQELKESQNIRVVLCSTQNEKLSLLLNHLKRELREEVDWEGSHVTPCHLTIRTIIPTKPGRVVGLCLIYKWQSEAVLLDSKDFVAHADSSAESACTPEVRFEGLTRSVKPEEAALSLLTSDDGHFSMEPFVSQRIQPDTEKRSEKTEYHFHMHQTHVTGHNCMVGDQTTLNTQTPNISPLFLPPGPSSTPHRSITEGTSPHESSSSGR